MPQNSIDVVILSWNRAEETAQAVESALRQSGVKIFVWVIDQGSDIENFEYLSKAVKQYETVKLVRLGKNYGVPGGRNRGIALGREEIVVCLDNDAVFKDDQCLFNVVQQFVIDPMLAALGFRIENYYTGDLDRLSWVYPRSLIKRSFEEFLATRFCGAGHALRRDVFESVGGYDDKLFFYWEELDLSYKFINSGFHIGYQPAVTVLHKISPEARISWRGTRYTFLVRNAIYIDWKYFHSLKRVTSMSIGYLIKGAYNGLATQAIKGVQDGLVMCLRNSDRSFILKAPARDYIQTHDLAYRGGILKRLRYEVFEKMR